MEKGLALQINNRPRSRPFQTNSANMPRSGAIPNQINAACIDPTWLRCQIGGMKYQGKNLRIFTSEMHPRLTHKKIWGEE